MHITGILWEMYVLCGSWTVLSFSEGNLFEAFTFSGSE